MASSVKATTFVTHGLLHTVVPSLVPMVEWYTWTHPNPHRQPTHLKGRILQLLASQLRWYYCWSLHLQVGRGEAGRVEEAEGQPTPAQGNNTTAHEPVHVYPSSSKSFSFFPFFRFSRGFSTQACLELAVDNHWDSLESPEGLSRVSGGTLTLTLTLS